MRSMINKRNLVRASMALLLLMIVLATSACGGGGETAQSREDDNRQDTYEKLVAKQPAAKMDFSPTRETKNFWIKTWDEPGKFSYVYMQNGNGDLIGYYVLEGLPVSYCVALIPPYKIYESSNGNLVTPAPSVDGTFSSGNNCNTFYGKDATTGAYVEYTVGLGINILLYDQPLPRQDVQPLGPTTIAEAKKG